jgi:hypothetical protein
VGVAQNVLELNQYFAEGLEVAHHHFLLFPSDNFIHKHFV